MVQLKMKQNRKDMNEIALIFCNFCHIMRQNIT